MSFIDAGKLVADATPAELRRRFSDGYRITIAAPPADRQRLLGALGDLAAGVTERDGALVITLPALGPDVLDRLATLDGAAVRLTEAPMTEVFRRVLQGVQAA